MVRHFVLFLVIVAILVAGNFIRAQLKEFESVPVELETLGHSKQELEDYLRSIEREMSERITTLEKASLDKLKSRVEAIEKEIQENKSLQAKYGSGFSLFSGLPIGKGLVDHLKRDVKIKVLEQERDILKHLGSIAEALRKRKAAVAELEKRRQGHVAAYAKLEQIQRELAQARKEAPWKIRIIIWSAEYKHYQDLKDADQQQRLNNDRAYDSYERQRKLVETITVPELRRFEIPKDQIDHAVRPLYVRIEELEERYRNNWVRKASGPAIEVVPAALLILLSIILLPIAIKVFLYFIVAPWAAGRPPIRLLPSASGSILSPSVEGTAGNGRGKMSAVSQPIVLGENQELLIQPEYLQSTSLQARKRTKWLLNASIPFTSLASGMFMLTRVGPVGSEPVVISATKDPLSEVGVIDLADGAAFVCQPRSLAGVIQDRSNPMRITRHWRLGSLQSWLTLQLRFLVFHGPGQLVMKGCRGIRIESAGTGRLINQAATLGFSANLDYANTRCETFVSYWTGKEDLFNDLFTGKSGVYVYEEMPDLKRTTGVGRHLEGFTDAILKVFGV